jgi:hypothetical protein
MAAIMADLTAPVVLVYGVPLLVQRLAASRSMTRTSWELDSSTSSVIHGFRVAGSTVMFPPIGILSDSPKAATSGGVDQ